MQNIFFTSYGIVLREPTHKNSIIVFDDKRGKVLCTTRIYNLFNYTSHAYFVAYDYHESQDRFILSTIETLLNPAAWLLDDIYYLHHLLELCHFFLPFGQTNTELFHFLIQVFYCHVEFKDTEHALFIKKVILCKLFILLGVHPDEQYKDFHFFSLICQQGDSMLDFQYNTEFDKKMVKWIYSALHQSGAITQLKTYSYIKRLGIVS